MHILFLTDNFPPEVNAPASRTFEHCREWVKLGNKVTIITCAPNFPRGRVYDGYRNRFCQRETIEGINIVRVWSYIAPNKGFLRRILDYLSFMVSSVVASPFIKDVDVVIATSPQFFTACSGYCISRLKRKPFIFELRDLWPESIKAVGAMRDSFFIRLMERVELFLYRKADLIVSVTESFKGSLELRGIDKAKIKVILNSVDPSMFHPRGKAPSLIERYNLGGKMVAGYIGTHGMAHGLDTVLKAAKLLQDDGSSNNFHFLLIGEGAEKSTLKTMANKLDLKNVTFIDQVPKEQIANIWSLMDVSIIHLKRNDLFKTVIPSKIFEAMGMGIPILLGVEGESARLVDKAGVGLLFQPDNPEELVRKLKQITEDKELYETVHQNCLKAAKLYDREAMAKKMINVILTVGHNQ